MDYFMTKKFGRFFLMLLVAFSFGTAVASAQSYEDACKKGDEALARKDYNGAIKEFSAAISIDTEKPQAYLGSGTAKYYLGKYEEAMTDVNLAITYDEKLAEAYNQSGLIREKSGLFEDAKADYEKALFLKPDYKEAQVNLENLSKKLSK
jgi:tetratricopeptide (TPR) repeat protein